MPDTHFKRTIFVVRPWHAPATSLYPPVMDGVEYIDGVIEALKLAFPAEKYDVRVDEDVFSEGESIRAMVSREVSSAEVVIVLLDGFRPNVLYELGIAHAMQNRVSDGTAKRVIPLAEQNATVLVRNYYRTPLQVPLIGGGIGVPLNPPLDLATAWSDGADVLVRRYDRLHLQRDISKIVKRIISSLASDTPKASLTSEGANAEDKSLEEEIHDQNGEGNTQVDTERASIGNLGHLYKSGDVKEVVRLGAGANHPKARKLVALSYMKLGRVSEALDIWKELLKDREEVKSSVFHIGVCNYAMYQFAEAQLYFKRAVEARYGAAADEWLKRTNEKLTSRPSEDVAPKEPPADPETE